MTNDFTLKRATYSHQVGLQNKSSFHEGIYYQGYSERKALSLMRLGCQGKYKAVHKFQLYMCIDYLLLWNDNNNDND